MDNPHGEPRSHKWTCCQIQQWHTPGGEPCLAERRNNNPQQPRFPRVPQILQKNLTFHWLTPAAIPTAAAQPSRVRERAKEIRDRSVAAGATRSSVNSRGGPRTGLALVRAAGIEPALPFWETDFKSVASTGFATLARFSVSASRPQKPADLLHLAQYGKGDRAGALSAIAFPVLRQAQEISGLLRP